MSIEDNLTQRVNDIFYITIATLWCTGVSLVIWYCYKLRCIELKCCCFTVTRDITGENKEEIQNLTLNTTIDKI